MESIGECYPSGRPDTAIGRFPCSGPRSRIGSAGSGTPDSISYLVPLSTSGAGERCDQTGTEKLFGSARSFAEKLRKALHELDFPSNVAVAPNAEASLLLARSYSGVTQVDQRDVQAKLAPLSLSMLRCEGATLATLTRWGIRNLGELAALPETALVIRTPATRHNADGIDIDSLTNATVNQSSIEAGDDGIAIKTNSAAASNITVENTRLYGTHGLSIGSQTFDGVTNVLFNNDYVYGVDLNGNASTDANAINIKTDPSCGGPVNKVLYQNICITEAKHLIVMNTAYGSCSGSPGTPVFTNIVVNGAKSINSVSGAYTEIHGVSSSNLIDAYLANISLDVTKQSSDQYADVALDNSNITPSGTGVTTRSFTVSGSGPTCSF